MSLRDDEQFVITAVAREYSAPWCPGDDPPDAYICLGGNRIPVEISTLMQPVADKDGTRSLIADDIATGAFGDALDRELGPLIPDCHGITLVTHAPIYQRSKTKWWLSRYLRRRLETRPEAFPAAHCVQVNDNRFEIYFDHHEETPPKKVNIGWMHRTGAFDLGDDTRLALKNRIEDKAHKCRYILKSGPVWLALLNHDFWLADGDVFRYALSQLHLEHPFSKILLVSKSGLAETLAYPRQRLPSDAVAWL